MKWYGILALATIAPWLIGDAHAAGTVEARMSAVAYAPVDGERMVEVRLYDDSDTNKKLKAEIETRLTAAGYTLTGNAPLILSFERSSTVGDGRPDDPLSRLELRGNSGTYGKDDYSASLKLFSSRTGEEGSPTAAYGGSVRLEVAVSSRANGRRVWQGWAVADSTGRESTETATALVAPLISAIGKTVRAQTVNAVLP